MTTETTFTTAIENVLEKTHGLHDALQSLTSTNIRLRFYCKKLLTKLGDFEKDFSKLADKCTICFEDEKDYVLHPCGHLMCVTCCERAIAANSCFVCRSEPEGHLKVFK